MTIYYFYTWIVKLSLNNKTATTPSQHQKIYYKVVSTTSPRPYGEFAESQNAVCVNDIMANDQDNGDKFAEIEVCLLHNYLLSPICFHVMSLIPAQALISK